MVVTVLEDSLTKAEHKLVEAGRSETVRQMRRDFQDAMQAEIRSRRRAPHRPSEHRDAQRPHP